MKQKIGISESVYILRLQSQLKKINQLMCNPSNIDKQKLLKEGNEFFITSSQFYDHLDWICNE